MLRVYDPCCGSGGNAPHRQGARHRGGARASSPGAAAVNPDANIHLFSREANPDICQSDLFMKSADSRDTENAVFRQREHEQGYSPLSG